MVPHSKVSQIVDIFGLVCQTVKSDSDFLAPALNFADNIVSLANCPIFIVVFFFRLKCPPGTKNDAVRQ